MKNLKLVAIGLAAGIILSVVIGLVVYFKVFAPDYNELQEKNYKLVKYSETLGEQLGIEKKKSKELKAELTSTQKELVGTKDQVKFLSKSLFIVTSQQSQGEAPLVSETPEKDEYIYEINTDKHFGTIVVTCKLKPDKVDYDITSREIKINISWAIVKQPDGSYKIIIESQNPDVHLENNEFIYLTEAKKWYQRLHGEALIGAGSHSFAAELVGGWDHYRIGIIGEYDIEKGEKEIMVVGGLGF